MTALMWDTLTFHFNDNAQHLVSVTMSGENWGNTSTYYRLDLFQPPDPNFYPQTLTMAQGVIPLPGGVYSVSTSMLVQNGMSVAVLAGMSMAGGGPSSGIAWDPDHVQPGWRHVHGRIGCAVDTDRGGAGSRAGDACAARNGIWLQPLSSGGGRTGIADDNGEAGRDLLKLVRAAAFRSWPQTRPCRYRARGRRRSALRVPQPSPSARQVS